MSKFGDGGSISSLSCRRRKGGVEKKPPMDMEGPRSKEDWAVVAADVDADVSEVKGQRLSLSCETHLRPKVSHAT